MGLFRTAKRSDTRPVTDIHCHILPALDDGSSGMEETVQMLDMAIKGGTRNIIATPHYKPGRCVPPKEKILETLAGVNEIIEQNNLNIKVHSGCEVFFCNDSLEDIHAGKVLTMNNTPYILAEFLPMSRLTDIRNMLYEVSSMGYKPIVAHIERYECFISHPELAEEIKSRGWDIQINHSSLLGDAGKEIKKAARRLLEWQYVDYVATDAHSTGRRSPDISECARWIYKNCDADYADAILFGNAEKKLNINL